MNTYMQYTIDKSKMLKTTVKTLITSLVSSPSEWLNQVRAILLWDLNMVTPLIMEVVKTYNRIGTTYIITDTICGATLRKFNLTKVNEHMVAKGLKPCNQSSTFTRIYSGMIMEILSKLPGIELEKHTNHDDGLSKWFIRRTKQDTDTHTPKGIRLPWIKPVLYNQSKVLGNYLAQIEGIYRCPETMDYQQSIGLSFNQDIIAQCPIKAPQCTEEEFKQYLQNHSGRMDKVFNGVEYIDVPIPDPDYETWKQARIEGYKVFEDKFLELLQEFKETFYETYSHDSRGRQYVNNDLADYLGNKSIRGYIEFEHGECYGSAAQEELADLLKTAN